MIDTSDRLAATEAGTENCAEEQASRSPEMLRREFLKRFGVYAAGSAVGLYVLMSADISAAVGSDGGGGDGR